MPRWFILLWCVVAIGCAKDDTKIVGAWHGPAVSDGKKQHPGAELTLDASRHFRELFGNMEVEGTWTLDGSRLTLTAAKVNGLDVAEARERLLKNADKATYPARVRDMAESLDKPIVLEVSDDAKTLRSAGQTIAGETLYSR